MIQSEHTEQYSKSSIKQCHLEAAFDIHGATCISDVWYLLLMPFFKQFCRMNDKRNSLDMPLRRGRERWAYSQIAQITRKMVLIHTLHISHHKVTHQINPKTPSIVCIPFTYIYIYSVLQLLSRDVKYTEMFSEVIHGRLFYIDRSPLKAGRPRLFGGTLIFADNQLLLLFCGEFGWT